MAENEVKIKFKAETEEAEKQLTAFGKNMANALTVDTISKAKTVTESFRKELRLLATGKINLSQFADQSKEYASQVKNNLEIIRLSKAKKFQTKSYIEQQRQLQEVLTVVNRKIREETVIRNRAISEQKKQLAEQQKLAKAEEAKANKQLAQQKKEEEQIKRLEERQQKLKEKQEQQNAENIKTTTNLYRLNAIITVLNNSLRVLNGLISKTTILSANARLSTQGFEQSLSELAETSPEVYSSIQGTITALGAMRGYTATDLQNVVKTFYDLAEATGLSQEESGKFANSFLSVVDRVVRQSGRSIEEVSTSLRQALLSGETESARQYGFSLGEKKVKQTALELGLIEDINQTLTDSEMVTLRTVALYTQINQRADLMANRGDAIKNSLTAVNGNIIKIQENLGNLVQGPVLFALNIANRVLTTINSIMQRINEDEGLRNWLGLTVGIGFAVATIGSGFLMLTILSSKLKMLFKDMADSTERIAINTARTVGFALSLSTLLFSLVALWKLNDKQAKDSSKNTENIAESGNSVAGSFQNATNEAKKLKNELASFDEINLLGQSSSTSTIDSSYVQNLMDSMQAQLDNTSVEDMIESYDEWGKSILLVSTALSTLSTILTMSKNSKIADLIYTQTGIALTKRQAEANNMLARSGMYSNTKSREATILKRKEALATITNVSAKKAEKVATDATATSKTKETMATAINTATTKKDTGAKIKNVIASIFQNAFTPQGLALLAIGATAGAGVTALVMSNMNKEPAMATGGVVSEPTRALIGEGRYPEAVVPLGESPQFKAMKSDIANDVVNRLGVSSGSSTTTNVYIGDKQIKDFVVKTIDDKLKYSYGTNLGNLARRR